MKVITIGRDRNQDICYDNEMISRRHAILRVYGNGKMEIVSLGQNGTCVNGNPCKPNCNYPLKRNDVVSFAHVCELDWSVVPNPLKWVKITALVVVILAVVAAVFVFAYDYLPFGKDKTTAAEQNLEEIEYEALDDSRALQFGNFPNMEYKTEELPVENESETIDTLGLFLNSIEKLNAEKQAAEDAKKKKEEAEKNEKQEVEKKDTEQKDSTTAIGNILS